jgi:hypothetical protein
LRKSGLPAAPDRLYTAATTQRFMTSCKGAAVEWAIFSDLYGIWFPDVKHSWYEKDPGKVNPEELRGLLADFDQKLEPYEQIWFYYPGRMHPLHRRLLESTALKPRVHVFSHKAEIA